MTIHTTGRTFGAGRFSFTTPEEMIATGRNQSIYRTNVKTIPIPPGGIEAYWKDRLARIGPVGSRSFDFQPGVRSSWSARNAIFPNILTLELVKSTGNGLLVVDREADAGRENLAETLVKDIIDSYVPACDHGFCVGDGAITLEPSQNEQARLSLSPLTCPGIEIQFMTRTVNEPDRKTYSDLDEEREIVRAHGGKLTVLLERKQAAAGLSGREVRISVTVPGEKGSLRFTWHFRGVERSSVQPSISIVGSAPLDKQERLEGIWIAVLTSLRSIPLSPAEQGQGKDS